MAKLPECMSVELAVHVTSDSTGLQARIGVGGRFDIDYLKDIDDAKLAAFVKMGVDALNEMGEVTDARPMTAQEAREYREDASHDSGGQFVAIGSDDEEDGD